MKPLDILFVGILPPQPGGGAISCGQLLGGLSARGHWVRALAPILGDGLLREAMQEAVADRKIADRFRFVGWMDYARVPAYLALADLVVMPSEGEGLSRVYLETQASGRVLVASDIAAAREVVADARTGLLFRKGDTADLADRLRWGISHPREQVEIGRRARAYIASTHTLDRAVSSYETVLGGVVGRQTAAAVGTSR